MIFINSVTSCDLVMWKTVCFQFKYTDYFATEKSHMLSISVHIHRGEEAAVCRLTTNISKYDSLSCMQNLHGAWRKGERSRYGAAKFCNLRLMLAAAAAAVVTGCDSIPTKAWR
mmetsp:Transcript_15070/g.24030  ORF Transcript_15070/g.24030 Transcript_15070/m.24030 type:complete len:114 (+) Transcript_15070:85-426(+)